MFVNRLCGITLASSRVNALAGSSSVSSITPAWRTMFTTLGAPPENASSGCAPNCSRIFGSVVRTERTGPTVVAPWQWKTAMNRVIPPSTTSS